MSCNDFHAIVDYKSLTINSWELSCHDRICTQNGYYSDETEDSDEDEDDDEETRSELNSDAYDDVKVNEQTSEDIDTDFVYHIEGDEVYDKAVEEYATSGTDDEY
jgi:hypothetical protein